MPDQPIVRSAKDVAAAEIDRCRGASIQVLLGPDDKMPNFYTRRFTLEPDGYIPTHRHDSIEHEQVMLEGEMVLTLDGKEQTVRAGDSVYIPAQVAHSYANRTNSTARFICIVPATADYQTEWLE